MIDLNGKNKTDHFISQSSHPDCRQKRRHSENSGSEPSQHPHFNPNSAAELATNVRKRRKPGAAKTQTRIISRSWVKLGTPLRFVFRDLLYAPKPTRC
jgi:hypothetical protein